MSKARHYTSLEKKIFLDILKLHKNIIENKKSNSATLKEKDDAWNKVAEQFNNSPNIIQERSIAQLKKLWTNIKQFQRNALTKEKQSRMATGGGPEEPTVEIDPDVSEIAPHLMITAPVIFSSNIESEIIEQREKRYEFCEQIPEVDTEQEENIAMETSNINKNDITRKRSSENELKIERVIKIMKHEEEMAIMRKKNEETLFELKVQHIKELHNLEIQHKKELYEYELKEAKLKLNLAAHKNSVEISKN